MASQVARWQRTHLPMQEMQKNAVSNSGSGRSPGVGNDNAFQYSCLENSMARGAWFATVQGITKSWM